MTTPDAVRAALESLGASAITSTSNGVRFVLDGREHRMTHHPTGRGEVLIRVRRGGSVVVDVVPSVTATSAVVRLVGELSATTPVSRVQDDA